MTHVDIYLETSSIFQGITDRKCGYVLSVLVHNEEKTREGFGHYKGTYHQTVLLTLAEALERMTVPSEICVHTRDAYVSSRILKLEELAGSGWKDTKGEPIRNAEEWKRVYAAVHALPDAHQLSEKTEKHSYSGWLQEEMEKRKDECRRTMGKGWSLRPEQDQRTMECLGAIIRSGTRFTYYKDEQGGIWFEDEPVKGKPEWMQRADRERRKRHGIYHE